LTTFAVMLHLQAAEFMAQSDDKKWQLVLQQDAASSKDPPAHYLNQLLVHIEAIEKQTKKGAKTKKLPKGTDPAGGLLRGLEISLRTNSLQWVKDFIGYQPVEGEPRKHGGLDILIDYFKKMDEEGRVDNHEHLCVLCLRALMNNAVSMMWIWCGCVMWRGVMVCACEVGCVFLGRHYYRWMLQS